MQENLCYTKGCKEEYYHKDRNNSEGNKGKDPVGDGMRAYDEYHTSITDKNSIRERNRFKGLEQGYKGLKFMQFCPCGAWSSLTPQKAEDIFDGRHVIQGTFTALVRSCSGKMVTASDLGELTVWQENQTYKQRYQHVSHLQTDLNRISALYTLGRNTIVAVHPKDISFWHIPDNGDPLKFIRELPFYSSPSAVGFFYTQREELKMVVGLTSGEVLLYNFNEKTNDVISTILCPQIKSSDIKDLIPINEHELLIAYRNGEIVGLKFNIDTHDLYSARNLEGLTNDRILKCSSYNDNIFTVLDTEGIATTYALENERAIQLSSDDVGSFLTFDIKTNCKRVLGLNNIAGKLYITITDGYQCDVYTFIQNNRK